MPKVARLHRKDSDGDDITDDIDNCPGTENGLNVDMLGCATNQRGCRQRRHI